MFDSLIYDFDGTLCDTYPIFADIIEELLHEHELHDDREQILINLKVTLKYAISQYDWGTDPAEIQRQVGVRRRMRLEEHRPIDGTEEILRYAIEQGKKNYLYTHTGRFVYDILDAWGMRDLFAGFIDGGMSFPMKPQPDALNFLSEQYGIDKKSALMIGDRDIDVLAGENAGMAGCLFDEGDYFRDFTCEYRIDHLLDLKKIM